MYVHSSTSFHQILSSNLKSRFFYYYSPAYLPPLPPLLLLGGMTTGLKACQITVSWDYKITTSSFFFFALSGAIQTAISVVQYFVSTSFLFSLHVHFEFWIFFWRDQLGHRSKLQFHTYIPYLNGSSPKGLAQKARWYLGNLKKKAPSHSSSLLSPSHIYLWAILDLIFRIRTSPPH